MEEKKEEEEESWGQQVEDGIAGEVHEAKDSSRSSPVASVSLLVPHTCDLS